MKDEMLYNNLVEDVRAAESRFNLAVKENEVSRAIYDLLEAEEKLSQYLKSRKPIDPK